MSTSANIESLVTPLAHPERWYEQNHRAHVVQLYQDDAVLLRSLSRFIGTALGAGDAAIVIATEAHRVALERGLNACGLDTALVTRQKRYVPLDAAEIMAKFMVDGMPDAGRFMDIVGGAISQAASIAGGESRRVVAFGEMVALLWAQGNGKAAIALEEQWNDLGKTHAFYLHCAYPIGAFHQAEHRDDFLKICSQHTGVIPQESYMDLKTDEDRLRAIAGLQQKAQALESEIEERKAVQNSLQRREAELADVLENALEGIQQVGPDQNILWANKALMDPLGYTQGEYVGRSLADFHADRAIFDDFWGKLMRREDIYNFPAQLRCKDGSVRDVLINSNGFWEAGQFIHTRCFVRDVTEHKHIERALKKNHEELEVRVQERTAEIAQANDDLRKLSGLLLRVQDEERRRLARDLHDGTAQSFTTLSLKLATAIQILPTAEQARTHKILTEALAVADEACREVRTFSYLLHPPLLEDAGLSQALRWYVDGFTDRANIEVGLQVPSGGDRLPPELETALFRIVQECLSNIHRHSGSMRAEVCLVQNGDCVELQVRDFGKGFTVADHQPSGAAAPRLGVGIRGMQERVRHLGGTMDVGRADPGTIVRAAIPVKSGVPASSAAAS